MNAKKTDKGGAMSVDRTALPTFSWMSCPPNLTAETASLNGLRTAETASSNGVRCFFYQPDSCSLMIQSCMIYLSRMLVTAHRVSMPLS